MRYVWTRQVPRETIAGVLLFFLVPSTRKEIIDIWFKSGRLEIARMHCCNFKPAVFWSNINNLFSIATIEDEQVEPITFAQLLTKEHPGRMHIFALDSWYTSRRKCMKCSKCHSCLKSSWNTFQELIWRFACFWWTLVFPKCCLFWWTPLLDLVVYFPCFALLVGIFIPFCCVFSVLWLCIFDRTSGQRLFMLTA